MHYPVGSPDPATAVPRRPAGISANLRRQAARYVSPRGFLAQPPGLGYTGNMADEARARRLRLPIAPEARPEVALATLGLLVGIGLLLGWPGWPAGGLCALAAGLWMLMVYFARNPQRHPGPLNGEYVSPADGRVLAVERVHEPHFLRGESLRLAIFMSFFDVHVNRSPAAGTVQMVQHTPGEFLQAFRPEASDRNEHNLIGLEHGSERLLVKQVAGIMARRIVCSVRPGQRVQPGERLGMIKLGSRVELFLQAEAQPLVAVGDRVQAGLTPIARRAPARSATESAWPARQQQPGLPSK